VVYRAICLCVCVIVNELERTLKDASTDRTSVIFSLNSGCIRRDVNSAPTSADAVPSTARVAVIGNDIVVYEDM